MERSTHTLAVKSQTWFVEALFSLIQQKPFHEITISELCKKASLDRRTFYRNFKDKQDVLSYYFSTLQQEFDLLLKDQTDHSFHSYVCITFEFWKQHLEFLKTAKYDDFLFSQLIQTLNNWMPAFYQKDKIVKSKKLDYQITFIVGGIYNALLRWIYFDCQESAEELATMLSEIIQPSIKVWPNEQ